MHVCPAGRINVLMNKVIVTVEKFSENWEELKFSAKSNQTRWTHIRSSIYVTMLAVEVWIASTESVYA
jgi:hypothetical protein